jgi:hypothetical protein
MKNDRRKMENKEWRTRTKLCSPIQADALHISAAYGTFSLLRTQVK